jgi:CRISPR-associated protein (Cas_Csm6)
MSSIILSFVGQQDPFSGNTDTEGSIVTLAKHLVEMEQEIKYIFLLYTKGTAAGAIDTRDWLNTELKIAPEQIETIPLPEALSQDPIDLMLAVAAVKDLLQRAQKLQGNDDYLEMNASSGTPAMKSAWGILQAAGYAPRGRVWQVRNPTLQTTQQARVFAADMGILRQEFDRKAIEQQLADYNYGGALVTVAASGLQTPLITALLQYGHSRSAFDFKKAGEYLKSHRNKVAEKLCQDIDELRQPQPAALLGDVFWSANIHLKNKNYCDFIIAVAQFQENALRLFLAHKKLNAPSSYRESAAFWQCIQQVDQGKLWQALQDQQSKYQYIRTQGELNNPTMIAILKYFQDSAVPINHFEQLREVCDRRNGYIHKLEGVAEIAEAPAVLKNMRSILVKLTEIPSENPFDRLNQEILDRL